MSDYGKGSVLTAATVLPATSAGLLFADKVHPLIVVGFMAVNALMLVLLVAHISRYLINRK